MSHRAVPLDMLTLYFQLHAFHSLPAVSWFLRAGGGWGGVVVGVGVGVDRWVGGHHQAGTGLHGLVAWIGVTHAAHWWLPACRV
jgi:hypothetical protein